MQVCISLQTDNHARTPPLSFFTSQMPFLPPNQQRQGTEGTITGIHLLIIDAARTACRLQSRVSVMVGRPSVCPSTSLSVCLHLLSIDISCLQGEQQQTCRRLLLLLIDGRDSRTVAAVPAVLDTTLAARRSAANAGSFTLTANVGGWTQTCFSINFNRSCTSVRTSRR